MEPVKDNNPEKKKRKIINRPLLVRSEKPGQVASANYNTTSAQSIWKEA